jgi:hypothetical protein
VVIGKDLEFRNKKTPVYEDRGLIVEEGGISSDFQVDLPISF